MTETRLGDGAVGGSPCRISAGGTHPASPKHPRTGLCDLHHREREQAKSRWRSAVHYYDQNRKRNRLLAKPPTWEKYEAEIEWTPVQNVFTLLDAGMRATLRNTADALGAQHVILAGFAEGNAYLNTDINDFRILSGRVLDVIAEAGVVLRYIGEEPVRN